MLQRLTLLILLLALVIAPPIQPSSASTILESTDALELVTSTTAGIDYTASFADHTSSTFTPGKSAGAISTATTTIIVGAPAAASTRQLKELTLRNTSTTTSNGLTLQRDVSGTDRTMAGFTLGPGEWMDLDANGTITFYTASGVRKEAATDISGVNGTTYVINKAGGAKDTAGYHYWMGKDAGYPGAFAYGSPGVNGFATDCSVASSATNPIGASQAGSHPLPDPASGALYLTSLTFADGLAGSLELIDLQWVNTGLAVTTTTAQTVTPPTLPARDKNGTNNGAGVQAALYALTALGNAGAVANTTISYTDQDGNAGNTGTFSGVVGWQAPATPVIGTWMPFQLAAGDSGIRNLASITLGTTYTSGTMSLVLYRVLAAIGIPVANVGTTINFAAPGIKIHPNSCLHLIQKGVTSTTASNVTGSYTIVER